MSKITNDGLIRFGTGCFIAVPIATVGVKGLSRQYVNMNVDLREFHLKCGRARHIIVAVI